jgi:hypothetical protein
VILVESTTSTKHMQQLCALPVNWISSAKTNVLKLNTIYFIFLWPSNNATTCIVYYRNIMLLAENEIESSW